MSYYNCREWEALASLVKEIDRLANSVHKLTGIAFWAKILGAPQKNTFKPGELFWNMDVSLDQAEIDKLTALGLGNEVKTKGDSRGRFVIFERREIKKSGPKAGQHNKPITVLTADGKPWDKDEMGLIGNGSAVEVKFNVYLVQAFGKYPAHNKMAILEVKVLNLVPYVKKEEGSVTGAATPNWKGDVV